MAAVVSPQLLLSTEQVMTLAQEDAVRASLAALNAPLEEGQTIELAGIVFRVIRP